MASYGGINCSNEIRRTFKSLDDLNLNGIDYIEVPAQDLNSQRFIHIHFIRELLKEDLDRLVGRPDLFELSGGVRIRDIEVLKVEASEKHLVVEVDKAGDFSIYRLEIKSDQLDPVYSQCDFSFKAGCPSRLDPKKTNLYPATPSIGPIIDYNAKDYASFRKALLDLIPTIIPDWEERHEADFGIMLLELLAYTGDQLSYFQDSVANESYLETALQRISVRRHARLIDYRMHDGASARAFLCFCVENEQIILPRGTQVLTRINTPLGTEAALPGPVIPFRLKKEALEKADAIFETFEDVTLKKRLNKIKIHTWGNSNCCLPKGTTTADLEGDLRDVLRIGAYLLFEEVKGSEKENVDKTHRQIVRIIKIDSIFDPLFDGEGKPRTREADPKMPITRVCWDIADELDFPLFISSVDPNNRPISGMSVARGNLVIADHGRREQEDGLPLAVIPIHERLRRAHRIHLKHGPLSQRMNFDPDRDRTVKDMLNNTDPHRAKPQILDLRMDQDPLAENWIEAPDSSLLNSSRFDPHFVVETDNFGRAVIRFGDGEHGRAPPEIPLNDESDSGDRMKGITVIYRFGVGRSGNVGPDTLVHIIDGEQMIGISFPGQEEKELPIYNPAPAWGGIDPEPIENVKKNAPAQFHAEQFRAVTEADYADAAMEHPSVDKAVAMFRWTGSWHTVFISIDPFGTNEVSTILLKEVKELVECRALAGYDIEIDGPIYVPLEIEADICASSDHFRSDVEKALLETLSNRRHSDGSLGFFYPDRFTFNQPLYLSELYDVIQSVEGVDSVTIVKFNRLGKPINDDIDIGYIRVSNLEIIRLDNDPRFPDNGILKLNVEGGK